MTNEFLSTDEVRRGYHSGLSGRAVSAEYLLDENVQDSTDKQVCFQTSKYLPPDFKVTLRTEINWTQDIQGVFLESQKQWVFTLPASTYGGGFKMKLVLHDTDTGADDADSPVGFWMSGGNVYFPHDISKYDLNDGKVRFAYQVEFTTTEWLPNQLVTLRNNIDGWGRDIFGVFRGDAWRFSLDRDLYPASVLAKFVLAQHEFMEGGNLTLTASQQFYERSDSDITFPSSPTAFSHGYDNLVSLTNPVEQATVRSVGREADDFDVIVIGSGMGGGVLADALSDQGAKVLVLEAGGLRMPVHMNELPRTETSLVGRDQLGHFDFNGTATHFADSGVHFNLGGRSIYWSGLIPRMQPWEFRGVWPDRVKEYLLGNGTDKSGYDHADDVMRRQKFLGPYQDKVVDLFNSSLSNDFTATDLPRSMHQPDLDSNAELQNVIQRSTGGFSSADLLLDSLGFSDEAGKNNLRVNLHHLAKYIQTSGDQAQAVVCEDLVGNQERTYRGKFIVLACGSLESAKLAKQSGLNDPNDKMGKGLTDHSAYFYKTLHKLPTTGPNAWLGDPLGHAKIMLRHKDASATAHAYNVELLINAKYWDTRHADDDLWRQRIENGEPAEVEIKFIFDSLLNDANSLTPNGFGKKPTVSVALNDISDAYKTEIVQMRNKILGALGVSGLPASYDPDKWSQGIHGSVHHAGGTLRMSDDGSGVVDADLKFEAYDNLYCCDVSVNPTIPAANPSLTLAALALRLADALKARVDAS